ncbi:flavodoxin family protein [Streptomyces olivaceus]|uniref:flavodoxin family protein n=1 Tax=Streptomyces olivaceus TaxID=47716 RepID=UPI003691721B
MRTVIVCASVAHGNTRSVADAMAEELGARVVAPGEADREDLAAADLVGFGSGVFYGRLHRGLTGFAEALPAGQGRGSRAFVFATSGLPEFGAVHFTRPLVRLLDGRGYSVAGSFSCRAFDTWGPFRLVGGIHKNRPDGADLSAARAYAGRLRAQAPSQY